MTSLRYALVAALILAAFVPVTVAVAQAPVEWYTDTGGGGILAQPAGHARNGGALAPQTATGPVDVPDSDISATPPVSSASQVEPVLGTPSDEAAPKADRPVPRVSQATPTVTGGQNQDTSTNTGLLGALPLTGLQLVAVAGAGLCLLLAGAALRPRRRPAAQR